VFPEQREAAGRIVSPVGTGRAACRIAAGRPAPDATAREQPRQVGLAHRERQAAQIFAIECEDIEGIELHFSVVLTGMQGVEVGDAVDPEDDGLSIDDEVLLPVLGARSRRSRGSDGSSHGRCA
jgi:hypothetical protein